MLAFALEINAQIVTSLLVLAGAVGTLAYGAYKKFWNTAAEDVDARVKASSEVAKVYEDLYRAEKEAHHQTKERLSTIEGRIKTLEESHAAVVDLNVKHQQTIREQVHVINNLRERLRSNEIAHEDIK